MPETTAQSAFPLFRTIAAMVGATAVLGGIASFLIPTLFPDAEQVNKTVVSACVLVGSLSVVSMFIVGIAAPFGIRALVTAFVASMGIRMIGVLGGAKLLTINEFLPTGKPLAMTLAAIYLPLLMIEVAAIMVYVNATGSASSSSDASGGPSSAANPNVSTEAGA